jgi:hypothetical protein
MLGINAEHQFYVIQTEFISPEKGEFTSVSKQKSIFQPRSVSFDSITAGKVGVWGFSNKNSICLFSLAGFTSSERR